jgi:hypothetical protein
MLKSLESFINTLIVEEGYPCTHRRMKKYIQTEGIDNWRSFFEKYVSYLGNTTRTMEYKTLYKYMSKMYPDIALNRAKEDCCDTCIRYETDLKSSTLSNKEKDQLKSSQKLHWNQARIQRIAMREAINLWGKKRIQEVAGILPVDQTNIKLFNQSVSRLPESIEDQIENISLNEDSELSTKNPIVLLQAEDFGGNLVLPWFGSTRPSKDYFTSNLNMYFFVITNLSTGINHEYLYDERAMGKDCDALCSLRFLYHFRQFVEARAQTQISSSPDTLYIIMDNCVGQNKSQGVFMFFSFLSMLFYKKIVLHYLESGHSHMAPDRVVSHVKKSLGKNNHFLPQQLIGRMNSVSYS